MTIYRWLCCALLVVFVAFAAGCGKEEATQAPQTATTIKPPVLDGTPVQDHYAVIHTSMGIIKVRLYGTLAPMTVKNFDSLVEQGYYKGLTFHRVIPGFMIQGGDNKKGGPGYTIPDEFSNQLHFNKMGILAMANRGPNTGDAQFFITLGPTPWLDNKHTIFGEVVQGMEVVEKIGNVPTDAHDAPKTPVTIESIELQPIPPGTSAKV